MNRLTSQTPRLIWLRPELGLVKWVLLGLLGLCLVSLGVGLLLTDAYRVQAFPAYVYYVTLQFIPRLIRGLLLIGFGLGLGLAAVYYSSRSLLRAVSPRPRSAIQAAIKRRQLQAGPKVVAIGGGTGLSTLLRGLKEVTTNITAVVTVADDGGSSGRLRRDYGVLPPGDLRQCLVALADAESLMGDLLQHRFADRGELGGHCFGNLFLTAMAEVTGSLDRALEECSRVLLLRGQVVPSTLDSVSLCAELEDGRTISGESSIACAGSPIRRAFLEPTDIAAHPVALQALREADVIIVGPGSLYTSLLPNLLVKDLAEAIRSSPALRVYVSNVANERGETSGFSIGDFLRVLKEHVGELRFDCVLANDNFQPEPSSVWPLEAVELVRLEDQARKLTRDEHPRMVMADLISEVEPTRHDVGKLEVALARLAVALPARARAR